MEISEKLNIALVQCDIVWEDIDSNLEQLGIKIQSIDQNVALIILPEMFSTGFTMKAVELAETMNGKTLAWMQKIASQKQTAITGSIIIFENEAYYNRLLFVHPSGKVDFYDKHHTFTLAKEHAVFSSGQQKTIINYKGWKICPLICYDLRFPVWSRNTENYDLLIYVASWPKVRRNAWNLLLKARAIENMSYTLGVNRIGFDGNNFEYAGDSIAVDYLGMPLSKENNNLEEIISITLNKKEQTASKNKFGFLEDGDSFVFKNIVN